MDDYKHLDAETAIQYVKEKTDIFNQNEALVAKVFEGDRQSVDGLCNVLVLIKSKSSSKSVVLKQVLPYVRALKEDGIYIPLTLERINTEVHYAGLSDKVMPGGVPKIHLWDKDDSILVMEDLSDMEILRNELIKMRKFPDLAKQLGTFLGRSAFFTSDMFLSKEEKIVLDHIFETNNNGGIFVGLIFDGTFFDNSHRTIYYKLQKAIDNLCSYTDVLKTVTHLRDVFINKKQCLIHTDLHTSNIFVDHGNMKVFDGEYAHYGPASYDVGRIIASLILNYSSLLGLKSVAEEERLDYQKYLLQVIKEIYESFEDSYFELCKKYNKTHLMDKYMDSMLKETMGFASCASISRIFDYGLTFDFKRIDDVDQRALGQGLVIELGKHFLRRFDRIENIDDVIKEIEAVTLKYKVKSLINEAFEKKESYVAR